MKILSKYIYIKGDMCVMDNYFFYINKKEEDQRMAGLEYMHKEAQNVIKLLPETYRNSFLLQSINAIKHPEVEQFYDKWHLAQSVCFQGNISNVYQIRMWYVDTKIYTESYYLDADKYFKSKDVIARLIQNPYTVDTKMQTLSEKTHTHLLKPLVYEIDILGSNNPVACSNWSDARQKIFALTRKKHMSGVGSEGPTVLIPDHLLQKILNNPKCASSYIGTRDDTFFY